MTTEAKALHLLSKEELINSLLEVELVKENTFLVVKETLTRMGVAAHNSNTLFQSCHILSKRGKFYIVHFKELFALDGRQVNFTPEDELRRNLIASTLQAWKLVKTVTPLTLIEHNEGFLTILPYNKKSKWKLVPKYSLGKDNGRK